jgi:hypothetical protein
VDTKIILNQGKYQFKLSRMERKLNVILGINLGIIMGLDIIMSGALYQFVVAYGKGMTYIFPEETIPYVDMGLKGLAYFYLFFDRMVSLAMMVILEILKLVSAVMMNYDAEMTEIDPETGEVNEFKL